MRYEKEFSYPIYHFRVTVFGAVLKSSTALFDVKRELLRVLAGKFGLSVISDGASKKNTLASVA